tara:strand:- start:657 stop:941 length:285 start_codon:yes stop_codon:yes gene_type:complete
MASKLTERKLVTDALNCENLRYSLEEVIGPDDNKEPHEYTDDEILAEAEYVLSCYMEDGHVYNEALSGDYSAEHQKTARQEVRVLKRFIKKYSN